MHNRGCPYGVAKEIRPLETGTSLIQCLKSLKNSLIVNNNSASKKDFHVPNTASKSQKSSNALLKALHRGGRFDRAKSTESVATSTGSGSDSCQSSCSSNGVSEPCSPESGVDSTSEGAPETPQPMPPIPTSLVDYSDDSMGDDDFECEEDVKRRLLIDTILSRPCISPDNATSAVVDDVSCKLSPAAPPQPSSLPGDITSIVKSDPTTTFETKKNALNGGGGVLYAGKTTVVKDECDVCDGGKTLSGIDVASPTASEDLDKVRLLEVEFVLRDTIDRIVELISTQEVTSTTSDEESLSSLFSSASCAVATQNNSSQTTPVKAALLPQSSAVAPTLQLPIRQPSFTCTTSSSSVVPTTTVAVASLPQQQHPPPPQQHASSTPVLGSLIPPTFLFHSLTPTVLLQPTIVLQPLQQQCLAVLHPQQQLTAHRIVIQTSTPGLVPQPSSILVQTSPPSIICPSAAFVSNATAAATTTVTTRAVVTPRIAPAPAPAVPLLSAATAPTVLPLSTPTPVAETATHQVLLSRVGPSPAPCFPAENGISGGENNCLAASKRQFEEVQSVSETETSRCSSGDVDPVNTKSSSLSSIFQERTRHGHLRSSHQHQPPHVFIRSSSVDTASSTSSVTSSATASPSTVSVGTTCLWSECDAHFVNADDIHDHLRTVHVDTQEKNFVCRWRDCKVFDTPSTLRSWLEQHIVKHGCSKPFKCIVDGCGLRFSSQALLERHVNAHFDPSSSLYRNQKRDAEQALKHALLRRKRRSRKSQWIAKRVDYFDAAVMEHVRHELWTAHERILPLDLTSGQVTLNARVIAQRRVNKNERQSLLHYVPENILPDVWIKEADFARESTKQLALHSLPNHLRQRLYRCDHDTAPSPPFWTMLTTSDMTSLPSSSLPTSSSRSFSSSSMTSSLTSSPAAGSDSSSSSATEVDEPMMQDAAVLAPFCSPPSCWLDEMMLSKKRSSQQQRYTGSSRRKRPRFL